LRSFTLVLNRYSIIWLFLVCSSIYLLNTILNFKYVLSNTILIGTPYKITIVSIYNRAKSQSRVVSLIGRKWVDLVSLSIITYTVSLPFCFFFLFLSWKLRVSKKTKKSIKLRKSEKQITEKTEPWKKNRLNRLEYLKNRSVRFGFISLKLKNQTEINNRAKLEKNRAKLKNTEPISWVLVFALK
jgi:hypothetical protein